MVSENIDQNSRTQFQEAAKKSMTLFIKVLSLQILDTDSLLKKL